MPILEPRFTKEGFSRRGHEIYKRQMRPHVQSTCFIHAGTKPPECDQRIPAFPIPTSAGESEDSLPSADDALPVASAVEPREARSAPRGSSPPAARIPTRCAAVPIQKFTRTIQDPEHLSFVQGGGHGGSHPHMVNEFLTALSKNRDPWPIAVQSANWTCVGICAHQSALKGGEIVKLPEFTL